MFDRRDHDERLRWIQDLDKKNSHNYKLWLQKRELAKKLTLKLQDEIPVTVEIILRQQHPQLEVLFVLE